MAAAGFASAALNFWEEDFSPPSVREEPAVWGGEDEPFCPAGPALACPFSFAGVFARGPPRLLPPPVCWENDAHRNIAAQQQVFIV